MDHQFENRDAAQLLREIAAAQQRNVRVVRIAAILVILLTAALLASLLYFVPKLADTLEQAHSTLGDTQQLIQRINTSLENLDDVGENLRGFSENGTQALNRLLDTLNAIDLDALSRSVQRFNSVLEGLSNFRLFG